MGEETWWMRVLAFAHSMIVRFEDKERAGWKGFDSIPEHELASRAVTNILNGDYIDGANLCLLAQRMKESEEVEKYLAEEREKGEGDG